MSPVLFRNFGIQHRVTQIGGGVYLCSHYYYCHVAARVVRQGPDSQIWREMAPHMFAGARGEPQMFLRVLMPGRPLPMELAGTAAGGMGRAVRGG